MQIGVDTSQKVFLQFDQPVAGLRFTPMEAINLAEKLIDYAAKARAEIERIGKPVIAVVSKLN